MMNNTTENEKLKCIKKDAEKARSYIELEECELIMIRKKIKGSKYRSLRIFADKVLMIHEVSLARKLSGCRRFQYHEIRLIEQALEINFESVDNLFKD